MKSEELAAWKSEFTLDPASFGYSGKTHEQIEELLKKVDRDTSNDAHIATSQLFELLDIDEYLALDPVKRSVFSDVLHFGSISPSGKNFTKVILHVFGDGSKTEKTFTKLRKRKGKRWEELGLPKPTVSEIADALR